jgi:hypothetical protein
MRRRVVVLLALMVTLVLVVGGVALAVPKNPCLPNSL